MFGLSNRELRILMQLVLEHADYFHRVILFGSRARGDHQAHSDIDLAVSYKKKDPQFQSDLEESRIPYTVDIVDLALEKETKLQNFIKHEGIVLYDEADKTIGEKWMTDAVLKEKLVDFQSALTRLREALSKKLDQDALYLDATIQRFEFTYELCWKLMKAYLHHLGIDINNPRTAIRESIKQEIISNKPEWFDMLEKRNLTTHTYHHDIALSVYTAIQKDFVSLFLDFENKITKLIGMRE